MKNAVKHALKTKPNPTHFIHGFDQGQEPRSGTYVRLKKNGAERMVLKRVKDLESIVLIEKKEDAENYCQSTGYTLSDRPRATMAEFMANVCEGALEGSNNCAMYLAAHWRGLNGSRYVNTMAGLFAELAYFRGKKNNGMILDLRRAAFLEEIFNATIDQPELMPCEVKAGVGEQATKTGVDGSFSDAVDIAMRFGEEQLNILDEPMEKAIEKTPKRGDVWFCCLMHGGIVLSTEEREGETHVHLIDQDNQHTALKLNNLTFADMTVSEEDIIAEEATALELKLPWIMLHKANQAMADNPPDYYACALMAAATFKAEKKESATAQKAWKLLLGAAKCVTPEQKKKLIALAPEILLAGQKKPVAKGMPDACIKAWRQHTNVNIPSEKSQPAEDKVMPVAVEMVKVPQAIKAARPIKVRVHELELAAMNWSFQPGPNTHDNAVQSALRWLGGRLGMTLPPQWALGGREISQQGIRVEIEAIKNSFAFRMEHPDAAEPTRTWRLEVTILSDEKTAAGGLRLCVQDRKPLPAPELGLPILVRYWAESPGIMLAGKNAQSPWNINSNIESLHLRRLLQETGREDVVWVFDAQGMPEIQPGAAGVALIATINQLQRVEYAKKFGPIEAGQAHYYLPGDTQPKKHSLTSDPQCRQLVKLSVQAKNFEPIPSFANIRDSQRAAQHRLHATPLIFGHAASDVSDIEDDSDGYADIEQHAMDLQTLLDIALEEKHLAEKESAALKKEILNLRGKLFASRSAKQAEAQTEDDAWIPDSLATIAQWAPEVFPKVVFADKALKQASKWDDHESPEEIYAALRGLATHYWEMRFGDNVTGKKNWDEFLKEHRMQYGSTGAALDNSHYSDAYQAYYAGKRHKLDLHIQGNSSRIPTKCIRIYFGVDTEEKYIVIGHMPTHLDNSLG